MKAKKGLSLAILGSGSDVGKSVLAAAFCRIFKNKNIRVAPFKAQNMSNNSFAALDGEMGRAQVTQAEAAGVLPVTDMNPVLLKPNSETGSQVIVNGKILGNANSMEYYERYQKYAGAARNSYDRLKNDYDLIVIEGAGSCAEVNLRGRDFANFEMAHYAGSPVLLVADIDRGGVFAQIAGTLKVISRKDRKRIRGIIINKFRGKMELFEDGVRYIEKTTSLPVLGVIPFFKDIHIDAEDSLSLDKLTDRPFKKEKNKFHAGVLRLPHISNFTDFEVFQQHPDCTLSFLEKQTDLFDYDLVVIPGSKNVRDDLKWLSEKGWSKVLLERAKQKKHIHGICGGFQILGKTISDPLGIEGEPGVSSGLGLLNVSTVLEKNKTVSRGKGRSVWSDSVDIDGYEIHMGKTELGKGAFSFSTVTEKNETVLEENERYADGAINESQNILGSYFHGLYDHSGFFSSVLQKIKPGLFGDLSFVFDKERQYNALAQHVESHTDMEKLFKIIGL